MEIPIYKWPKVTWNLLQNQARWIFNKGTILNILRRNLIKYNRASKNIEKNNSRVLEGVNSSFLKKIKN